MNPKQQLQQAFNKIMTAQSEGKRFDQVGRSISEYPNLLAITQRLGMLIEQGRDIVDQTSHSAKAHRKAAKAFGPVLPTWRTVFATTAGFRSRISVLGQDGIYRPQLPGHMGIILGASLKPPTGHDQVKLKTAVYRGLAWNFGTAALEVVMVSPDGLKSSSARVHLGSQALETNLRILNISEIGQHIDLLHSLSKPES